jgi:antitoxin Phd
MYNLSMTSISAADARKNFAEVVARAQEEAVFIDRRGEPAAVVISPEQYDRMMTALEDAEDLASFDAAMAEEGDNIPWDQVKADLGWV